MGNENSREFEKINPYSILGVDKDSTLEQINNAYRAKAKIMHPDKHRDATGAVSPQIEFEFKILQEAHKTLSDPKRRKMYDTGNTMSHADLVSMYADPTPVPQPAPVPEQGTSNEIGGRTSSETRGRTANSGISSGGGRASKGSNVRRRQPNFAENPDIFIPKNNDLKDTFSTKADRDAFNDMFEAQRAKQPNDVGYGDQKRMEKEDIKGGYSADALKPQRLFKKDAGFDNNYFNAVFEKQKKEFEKSSGHGELAIRTGDPEGYGGVGQLSDMIASVSTYNGLMVVGNDSNFGGMTPSGGFYDYSETFQGPTNPTDSSFVSSVDPSSYTDKVNKMTKDEIESAYASRMSQYNDPDSMIEPHHITEEEHLRSKLKEIEQEAQEKAEFTRRYAMGQYPQHFLDSAEQSKLPTSASLVDSLRTTLRLDGRTGQSDQSSAGEPIQRVGTETNSRRKHTGNRRSEPEPEQMSNVGTRDAFSLKDDFNNFMQSRNNDPYVNQLPPNTFAPLPRASSGYKR